MTPAEAGIRIEPHIGRFRCSECFKLYVDSNLYMVNDGVKMGMELSTIKDIHYFQGYNYNSSGWCEKCVDKLLKESIWRRIQNWFNDYTV